MCCIYSVGYYLAIHENEQTIDTSNNMSETQKKHYILSKWKEQTQKARCYIIPFILNSGKGSIIMIESRAAVASRWELGKGIDRKGNRGTFGVDGTFLHYELLCWLHDCTSVKAHQIVHLKLANLWYVILNWLKRLFF